MHRDRHRLALVVALVLGCGGADAQPVARLTMSRDVYDLYGMAALPDGYVLERTGGLTVFELDDTPRFGVSGAFYDFRLVDDALVGAAAVDHGASVVAWSVLDGAELPQRGRIEAMPGGLDARPGGGALLDDGTLSAYGGHAADPWWGVVRPFSDPVIEQRPGESRDAVVPAGDNRAYVVQTTAVDETGTGRRMQLSLVDADGVAQWSVGIIDTLADDPTESPQVVEQLVQLASAGGDAFVITVQLFPPSDPVWRRYDDDGTLVWEHSEPDYGARAAYGRPIVAPNGSLLWLDNSRDAIRLRWWDDAGEVLCTAEVPGSAALPSVNAVVDVAFIGEELFVVTIDRINRIALRPWDPDDPCGS